MPFDVRVIIMVMLWIFKIININLIIFSPGVHNIAYAFPKVRIVTTAVDPCVNEKFYIVPGIGNFGDRYFGTEPSDQ